MLKYIGIISLFFIMSTPVYMDSLWSKGTASVYNTIKTPRVGDLITIYISAQSSAVQEAGTNTSKRANVGANLYDLWDQYSLESDANESLRKMQNYQLGGTDDYSGIGKTTRTSKVKAVVSAVVTEILNNGNLVVIGEHSVNVNDETEVIRISGIVRPEDISPRNTIFSYQLAQSQISVKGDGVVGSKQTPGILTKMFNWVF